MVDCRLGCAGWDGGWPSLCRSPRGGKGGERVEVEGGSLKDSCPGGRAGIGWGRCSLPGYRKRWQAVKQKGSTLESAHQTDNPNGRRRKFRADTQRGTDRERETGERSTIHPTSVQSGRVQSSPESTVQSRIQSRIQSPDSMESSRHRRRRQQLSARKTGSRGP